MIRGALRLYLAGTSTELVQATEANWRQRLNDADELSFRYPQDGPHAASLVRPQQVEVRKSDGSTVLQTFTIDSYVPPRSRPRNGAAVLEVTAYARALTELDQVITECPLRFTLAEPALVSDIPSPDGIQSVRVLPQPADQVLRWPADTNIGDNPGPFPAMNAGPYTRVRIGNEIANAYRLSGENILRIRRSTGYINSQCYGAVDQPAGAQVVFQHSLGLHIRILLHYFQDKAAPGTGPILYSDPSFIGYMSNQFWEFAFDGLTIREALDMMYVAAGQSGVMYVDKDGYFRWRWKAATADHTIAYGDGQFLGYEVKPNHSRLATRVYVEGGAVDGEAVKAGPLDRNTALYGVHETTLRYDQITDEDELEALGESYLDQFAEPLSTYRVEAWEGDDVRGVGDTVRLRDVDYDLDATEVIVERTRALAVPTADYHIGAEPLRLEQVLENLARSRSILSETYSVVEQEATKESVGLGNVDNYQQVRAPDAYGPDLIENGDCETFGGGLVDGWTQWGTPSLVASEETSDVYRGAASQKMVKPTGPYAAVHTNFLSVTTGKAYRVRFSLKVVSGSVRVRFRRDDGRVVLHDFGVLSPSSWTRYEEVVAVGASMSTAVVAFESLADTGCVALIDDVSVQEAYDLDGQLMVFGGAGPQAAAGTGVRLYRSDAPAAVFLFDEGFICGLADGLSFILLYPMGDPYSPENRIEINSREVRITGDIYHNDVLVSSPPP